MRLNRRVPVGTHGGVRGRLSIHESLLLDWQGTSVRWQKISGMVAEKVRAGGRIDPIYALSAIESRNCILFVANLPQLNDSCVGAL